ncbi:MAG: hypothetical protein AAF614_12170 [Chloroflexota bacterium]
MASQKVITSIEEVTVEWLTAVLTRSGALTTGHVLAFDTSGGAGHWSQNARLTLIYSDDTQGSCPTNLFLKLVTTDLGDGEFFLPSEVNYYTRDYIDVVDAPLVRCFVGAYDAEQHFYHLLLEDKSATHKAAYDLKPTLAYGQALGEAFAILHARWWGPAPLQQIGATIHDAAHIREATTIGKTALGHAQAIFGERFKPHWPALIAEIYAKLPDAAITRAQDITHFTLIHGDPNEGNILVPHKGERPLFLIDQQPFDWSLTTWLGVYDLAYAMALYWQTDLRRRLEIPVLRHYHAALIQRGITHYDWEQLYNDYRLCVALTVPVAIEYMDDGGDPDWNEFRYGLINRTLTAFDDLNCAELL